MSFTNFLETEILDHVFAGAAYTAPGTLYLGLYTATPSDTGGGTELSGSAYARLATSGNLMAYGTLSASKVVATGDVFRIPAGDLDITLT